MSKKDKKAAPLWGGLDTIEGEPRPRRLKHPARERRARRYRTGVNGRMTS